MFEYTSEVYPREGNGELPTLSLLPRGTGLCRAKMVDPYSEEKQPQCSENLFWPVCGQLPSWLGSSLPTFTQYSGIQGLLA